MGDEDDVGFRELVVVSDGSDTCTDGVDLNLRTVVVDFDTGMLDACDGDFLAALGDELIHLLCGVTAGCRQTAKQNGKNALFHILFIWIFYR